MTSVLSLYAYQRKVTTFRFSGSVCARGGPRTSECAMVGICMDGGWLRLSGPTPFPPPKKEIDVVGRTGPPSRVMGRISGSWALRGRWSSRYELSSALYSDSESGKVGSLHTFGHVPVTGQESTLLRQHGRKEAAFTVCLSAQYIDRTGLGFTRSASVWCNDICSYDRTCNVHKGTSYIM